MRSKNILTASAVLSTLVAAGTLLGSAAPASASHHRRRHYRVVTPYYGSYYGNGYYNDRVYRNDRVGSRRPWGDLDGDGIPNKYDRDKDGDGRRNGRDDHPKNPFRR